MRLVERIHATLKPAGILLCRLNSTKDRAHGAAGYPSIEENDHLVEGLPKRFFDLASIDRLFSKGWRVLSIEEMEIARYSKPKSAWEILLEKDTELVAARHQV